MIFTDETISYLQGKTFTNALTPEWIFDKDDHRYRTQIDLLCELSAKKSLVLPNLL